MHGCGGRRYPAARRETHLIRRLAVICSAAKSGAAGADYLDWRASAHQRACHGHHRDGTIAFDSACWVQIEARKLEVTLPKCKDVSSLDHHSAACRCGLLPDRRRVQCWPASRRTTIVDGKWKVAGTCLFETAPRLEGLLRQSGERRPGGLPLLVLRLSFEQATTDY